MLSVLLLSRVSLFRGLTTAFTHYRCSEGGPYDVVRAALRIMDVSISIASVFSDDSSVFFDDASVDFSDFETPDFTGLSSEAQNHPHVRQTHEKPSCV